MAKIDFLICGRKGFTVLQDHVHNHGSGSVNCIASYPDKKVLNDPFDELQEYCRQHNIILVEREKYQPSDNIYRFVIGWQWIFPAGNDTIVFHDSLLPKYRGFAPLVNSLINGEKQAGVTAFLASDDYDEGDIIAQQAIKINYPVSIGEMMQNIIPLYSMLVDEIFTRIIGGKKIKVSKQDHDKATYSLWRDEDDYAIDWEQSAEAILRFINAVGFPYAGATSDLNGNKVIITAAEIYPDVVIENRVAGKVIFLKNEQPVVVCKKGLLKIIAGVYADSGQSIIPFTRLRSRFA
jgi:methionyl-tRNA formyltransferase